MNTQLATEPDCVPLSIGRRLRLLTSFAISSRRTELIISSVAFVAVALGIAYWIHSHPSGVTLVSTARIEKDLLEWLADLQKFVGFFTLLIAIFVWFGELREEWRESLPCRMSVYFFHADHPAIVCRHIWLAGADDLRAWGQQVAAQAVGERFLDFSPEVAARPPVVVVLPDGSTCRLFHVHFKLTRLPTILTAAPGTCRYQNLIACDIGVRTEPVEAVEALPDVLLRNKSPSA